MELEPEAYQQYYLDCYSDAADFVYEGIFNLLTEAFEAYNELEKVEIISYKNYFEYREWAESDLMERPIEAFRNDAAVFTLHPYEIKTVLFKL